MDDVERGVERHRKCVKSVTRLGHLTTIIQNGAQLTRASASIASNIVEGCGRGTVPEFRRFLLIARGSAQETLSHLRLATPVDDEQRAAVRSLQSSTVLILKMLTRLYENPPPNR